uniref:Uncharacterized protein n=1 Tax=Eutreptiella gymnastica TaxID=73025 RepID=A0A6T2I4I0_9EUGL
MYHGFILAGLYNLGILIFSKGLGNDLGEVDALFDFNGCISVLLWGAAYVALASSYDKSPGVAMVFAVEKLFYGFHWLRWMGKHMTELPALVKSDPLTGAFFAMYGAGDLAFMAFFAYVACCFRRNISVGQKAE